MARLIVCGGLSWAPTLAERLADEGRYLESYDPDGEIKWTDDKAKALRLVGVLEALTVYRLQSVREPLRPDGEPNRPLTAYNIQIVEEP